MKWMMHYSILSLWFFQRPLYLKSDQMKNDVQILMNQKQRACQIDKAFHAFHLIQGL